ncbi:attractin isoform X2 [Leptopilina heterotoma]|uniref:attractin isoform X2 n=1 Tax=Leptopilina heterotoma TaxID=63436 RepID=UPI001CA9355F|nr:attractin isoform X2 [Leptopilina heterotoma]
MAEVMQMFLFLFKSKYRRKSLLRNYKGNNVLSCALLWLVIIWASVLHCAVNATSTSDSPCDLDSCVNGACVNGSCICHEGWQGPACQYCGGKVRLTEPSGSIQDGIGNYTTDVKCSWLIESNPNSTIRMHIEEFATECGWDHLYIFDGDSVEAPLLGVFTGLMHKDGYHIRRVPEVIARSGNALLHFYSDVAYNMSGFNITYKINACPSRYSHADCSGHGVCIEGVCTCDATWTGEACDEQVCPNNCSAHHGQGECNREKHHCECARGFKGSDCSQRSERGYWESITYKDFSPEGSASHCAIVWRDSLYVVGGESFHRAKMIYVYDFNGNVWETPHVEGKLPLPRYGHSCVLFGDKIYLYGGVIQNSTVTNELWAFDVSAKVWENVTVHDECSNRSMCGPLKVAGHTANLVHGKTEKMVIIFGHSPQYGYLNTVQEYHFGTREWQIVETYGFPVKGGYGHSSAHDPLTNLIYVYGGCISESQLSQTLTSRLYSYNYMRQEWRLLTSAPSARFFHTGVFITSGMMIVFGGNTHNDTLHSHGARCYSSDTIAYDAICDSWHQFPMKWQGSPDKWEDSPKEMVNLPRYGHSSTVFEKSMYIYGGFDGQMLSDMLRYTPGICEHLTYQNCLNARIGVKCVWDRKENKCVPITKIDRRRDESYMKCFDETPSRGMTSLKELCRLLTDCSACVQTSYNCVWCGKVCSHEICHMRLPPGRAVVTELDQCEAHTGIECLQFHTCQACSSNPYCTWSWSNGPDRCKPIAKNRDLMAINVTQSQRLTMDTCRSPCVEYTSCRNCTESECIWCQNQGKCVDRNAYPASFPYGQCREWTTLDSRCRATETGKEWCSFYSSCSNCISDPACGWCDDGSGTGRGRCMSGGARHWNSGTDTCVNDRWYFTECPTCQCNGHSTCLPNSSVCIQPCANLTYGSHCDKCIPGYYGSPVNGATCQRCFCNGQASQCTSETGKCFCTTKGITGDHCERCDVSGLYHGDPTKGSCFYDLAIDYQFTFNLSKKEDRHYTAINFKNSPPKPDVDAEFTITCSVFAKMNITFKKINSPELPLLHTNCSTYKQRFYKTDYNFGSEDNNTLTTFYVYVYDFQPPLWIQISFSQYSKLNLQQFFITFSTCFFALLMVAAFLWKIKQKYDLYRRRQRLFVEMQQMANRAFSQVLVEIEKRDSSDSETDRNESELNNSRKKKKDAPSPIALEPCSGNRAAVLSLLVRLPTGGEPYTPEGQSAGLAVASALVTLGSPRRPSQELTTKEPKKSRKSASQHPDSTCI